MNAVPFFKKKKLVLALILIKIGACEWLQADPGVLGNVRFAKVQRFNRFLRLRFNPTTDTTNQENGLKGFFFCLYRSHNL